MMGNNLKIYTMIPNVSGHIGQWREILKSVKWMGFDAVHFLPLTETGGSRSPYALSYPFSLDTCLQDPGNRSNNPGQLEDLLKEAGLSGCLDMVFNHVACDGYIARNFPQWIKRDRDGAFQHAHYLWHGEIKEWGDLVLLDYDYPDPLVRKELWDYMFRYADLWAGISAKTGGMIRLDNLHSSHPEFLKTTLDRLREKYGGIMSIGELFTWPDKKEAMVRYLGIDYLLATQWEHNNKFVPGLRRYLEHLHKPKLAGFFFPISTHDSGTPAEEYGCVSATIPRYAVSALLSMGATGIVQRVEYGQPKKINFIGHRNLETNGQYADFRQFFRTINQLGKKEVFYSRGNVRFVDNGHDAIIAGYRENGNAEEKFLVIANFDIHHRQHISIRPQDEGIPFDPRHMPEGERYHGTHEKLDFTLPPCGVKIIHFHPAQYSVTGFAFDKASGSVSIDQSLS